MKEQLYRVRGMHCSACEILVEKKLLAMEGVKSVDASVARGEVLVEYDKEKPSTETLNEIFKQDNYSFFEDQSNFENQRKLSFGEIFKPLLFAIAIVGVFLLLEKLGIASFLNVSSSSSLITFLGLGILAGFSSCAALVGGIVLSMSKQWASLYEKKYSTLERLKPHLLFNAGRILSYTLLGAILGLVGSRLQISFGVSALMVLVVSLVMIVLGLQMLGVRSLQKFQVAMPKVITRNIASEENFQGKYMPFVMGALTFFLPCGFTITAQGLALLSASALQGGLIMGMFALGTAPMLLFIGLSSIKFLEKPHLAETFSRVAGFLVVFFALYNIYHQINILRFIL